MFWGFFFSGGIGPLVSVEGKINGEKFKSILENYLIPFLKNNGQNLTFIQDNAPVHTCRLVSEFLVDNEVPVLNWPPQSPDLNPIENLWHILKSRRAKKFGPVRTKSDIITQTLEIWNEFGIEICEKLSRSLKKRLLEVIEKKEHKLIIETLNKYFF